MSVFSLLVLYRNYGGYYYRSFMASVCLLIMSVYGFTISLVFPLLGLTHLINYSVAWGYYTLGGFFTGIKVESEGEENLHKVSGPVIYVCNHQSSMDIMIMGKVYPKNTAIVAKKQLKYYPFLGWFSK
jgi:lysophosphatidate acyltransferase